MARRMPLTKEKLIGNVFVFLVIFALVSIYYAVISSYKLTALSFNSKIFLSIFHISTIMLIWSFIQAMITDPGTVPALWGFHMGNSDKYRKKYCLICHVFKPDRCHHCSVCNRCVLNMDHHCPWLNNCVGFYNKKYFLLVIFYAICSTNLAAIALSSIVYRELAYVVSIGKF